MSINARFRLSESSGKYSGKCRTLRRFIGQASGFNLLAKFPQCQSTYRICGLFERVCYLARLDNVIDEYGGFNAADLRLCIVQKLL